MSLLTRSRSAHLRAAVPDAATPALALDAVDLYYGESRVVEEVSLTVEAGRVTCVMGRNGAGKTTLLRSVVGAMRPRRGSIRLFGADVTRWPAYERARAGIGYVPQGRGIFPYLTVLENLLVGLEPVGGRDEGGLEEMFALFPVLKEMTGRTAGVLSGGQQQQLAIARALLGRPRLLVLDEPTEGIQPSIVEQIEGVIAGLRGHMSILLVEQFLRFALAVADDCYVMERGVIVLQGAPGALDRAALQEYLAL